jgi:hypothetical protein
VDISALSLEQLNREIARHQDLIWSNVQKNAFRAMIPSRIGANMNENNVRIARKWKEMTMEERRPYDQLCRVSKIKFIDQVISLWLKSKKKPNNSSSNSLPNFDDDDEEGEEEDGSY